MKRSDLPSLVKDTPLVVSLGRAGLLIRLNISRIACALLCSLPVVCAPSLLAQADNRVEAVTVRGGEMYSLRGEQAQLLTAELKLPFDVEIKTNGTFQIAAGKERKLEEGQVLIRDGWLLNSDGSIQPVFDHVAMKSGRVIVVRDGEAAPLKEGMTFPNNLRVDPAGWCVYPSGANTRLVDGQLFRLDGTPVPAKDTVSLKNGRVVVQKDGATISLSGIQIMGMRDGTRVQGDGTVRQPDGTMTKLREGQTVFVEGVVANR